MPKKLELANSENPYFTIVSRGETIHRKRTRGVIAIPTWNCICKACNKPAVVQQQYLSSNRNRSCGCSLRKRGAEHRDWAGFGELYLNQFTEIKNAAIKRSIPFELTGEFLWELFLKQNKTCALTGEPLTLNRGITDRVDYRGNASLDRIDNDKGYTPENVRWVLRDANLMKRTLSDAQLLHYAKLMLKYSLPKGESMIISNQ